MTNLKDKSGETSGSREWQGKTSDKSDRKKILLTVAIAVVLLGALWIWKNIQLKNNRQEAGRNEQMIKERSVAEIIDTHKEHLRLLAKPYVWAVRGELLKGNISQVNLYGNEMVKEKNFQNIVIANKEGIIIASTNKKHETQPFSSVAKASYLTSDSTIVDNVNDSVLVMSSPIMGFNNRLGTMMITYKIQKPNL